MRHRAGRSAIAGLTAMVVMAAGCTQGAERPASDYTEAGGEAAAERWVSQEFTPPAR
ncbi:hypothetical protein [Nonomuraea salmonea]|uniref:hypothetical protein n=1 Tax=Nonomuraea salmonea TaxID=46181 RepID=UPI002FED7080